MYSLTRRDFSKLVAASPLIARGGLPTRRLGKLDFQAGILGWGAQRIGEDGADQKITGRIVAEAIDNGVNYFDTAPNYGLSEERVGAALKGRRDKVFLVTKIETRTRADAMNQIRESLRKLRTDHVDAVLIHNLARDDRYPNMDDLLSESGSLGALREAKKQGMVRHLGMSAHTNLGRIIKAFDTGEFELIMLPLNFVTGNTYNYEERLLPEAQRRKIAVIAMKVLGGPTQDGGARLSSREDFTGSLRYVLGIPEVSVAIIGMRTPEQLRQGLAVARTFRPLEAAEKAALGERGKALAAKWGLLFGPVG